MIIILSVKILFLILKKSLYLLPYCQVTSDKIITLYCLSPYYTINNFNFIPHKTYHIYVVIIYTYI